MLAPLILPYGLSAALLLAAPAEASQRVLIQDGRSDYSIVLAPAATKIAHLAAKELQQFLDRATGVKLPIVTEAAANKGRIFVGPNPSSEAAGVRAAELPPEGFRLKTIGRDIHIVGVDALRGPVEVEFHSATQTGTLSGVYEFLGRCAGVMFLWHDELGTIVPRNERLTVPDLDVNGAPDWSYRYLPYSPEGATSGIFGRRLRLGHPFTVSHAHAWSRVLPVEKYGAEHPEYFAEIDGQRVTSYYSGRHGGQLCTTNPEVIELFAQAAIEQFRRVPGRDMFSISPNDGGGFCRCAKCRALDVDYLDEAHEEPVLTDRLLTFYNAVAERVATLFPDKLLGAYVYSDYKQPPRRVRPHSNLALFLATNSARHQGLDWQQEQAWEAEWRSLTPRLFKYDIYYLGKASLHLPAPVTQHLVERIKAEHAVGIQGGYLYIGQSYEQLGAGHWLLSRLMWDRDADAAQLEQAYYQALYGAAASDVHAWYRLLEQRLRKVRLEGIDVNEPAVSAGLRSQRAGGQGAYVLAAYWPILDQASRLIDQARQRPLDPLQRQRLERLVDHHDLLVWTVRGLVAAGRLEARAEAADQEAARLVEAVKSRQDVIGRLARHAPTLVQYLQEADNDELERLSPSGAFYRLAWTWIQGTRPKPVSLGNVEKLSQDQAAERLRFQAKGGASIELSQECPYAGRQAILLKVPEQGQASLTFSAPAQGGTSYRLLFAHRDQADEPRHEELCIRTRVIFRDEKGKAVTESKQYSWNQSPVSGQPDQWTVTPHLFTTPAETKNLSITFFYHYPGKFWLDEVVLETLSPDGN